jgi:hypothetical protein
MKRTFSSNTNTLIYYLDRQFKNMDEINLKKKRVRSKNDLTTYNYSAYPKVQDNNTISMNINTYDIELDFGLFF